MHQYELPQQFLNLLGSITAKRPKTVIDHILENGFITTEELSGQYNYDHPPRAARDVRELGIPLETFHVVGAHGRTIAAYRFGNPAAVRMGRLGGRKVWPRGFKNDLVALYGSRCGVCFTEFAPRYLQIDHRVPFEIAGDANSELDPAEFMLLCGSCNRAKSWSCEHCKNWTTDHLIEVCETCYWAAPENYAHVALKPIRRLDLVWSGDEVPEYDHLIKLAGDSNKGVADYVKNALRNVIGGESQ